MANDDDGVAPSPSPVLEGREVIVGVCGGIAAYKVADVVSRLVQLGAGVTVVMTGEAQRFVTPLTFEALSGRAVRTGTFDLVERGDAQHIGLTERADLMLVAPATNHTIAKVAHGLCDDLLSLMVCAAACPVVFAPAMNARMWAHPVARANVAKLAGLGYRFIGPEPGWLACRNVGIGRLSEPGQIVGEVTRMLIEPGALPAPVTGDPAPVRDGAAPVRDGAAPVRDGAAPVRDGAAPVTDGAAPVRGDVAPAAGDELSAATAGIHGNGRNDA